jgi:hypothetical protein
MNGHLADKFRAALAYADHGWPMFVLSASKIPLANCEACKPEIGVSHDAEECGCLTCHGFYAATTDPVQLTEMLAKHPGGLLAVRTGLPSGTVVIDVDPRHGGLHTLNELGAAGLLPGTVNAGTGSDGLHFYYAHPGGWITSGANRLGPGVDVKADGAYVVAAPSRHPKTGRPYRWTGPDDVFTERLTPIPPALMALLRPVEQRRATVTVLQPVSTSDKASRRRITALVRFVLEAPEGERNQRLYWASCRATEVVSSIPQTVIAELLQDAAEQVGLPAGAAAATIRSAMARLLGGVA